MSLPMRGTITSSRRFGLLLPVSEIPPCARPSAWSAPGASRCSRTREIEMFARNRGHQLMHTCSPTVIRHARPALLAAACSIALAAPAMAQNAPADNPVLTFFRSTEVSGFVDTYYAYNFNKPASPCATVAGVAFFTCPRNFDVQHNSFSLNLAEVALEKKPARAASRSFSTSGRRMSATSHRRGCRSISGSSSRPPARK